MFNRSTANYVYEEKIKRSPKLTMLRFIVNVISAESNFTSGFQCCEFEIYNSKPLLLRSSLEYIIFRRILIPIKQTSVDIPPITIY